MPGRVRQSCCRLHGSLHGTGVSPAGIAGHDPETRFWHVSPVFAEEGSQDRETPESRDLPHEGSCRETRTRGAVLQARRLTTLSVRGPARHAFSGVMTSVPGCVTPHLIRRKDQPFDVMVHRLAIDARRKGEVRVVGLRRVSFGTFIDHQVAPA